jgi:hypothetical protein
MEGGADRLTKSNGLADRYGHKAVFCGAFSFKLGELTTRQG